MTYAIPSLSVPHTFDPFDIESLLAMHSDEMAQLDNEEKKERLQIENLLQQTIRINALAQATRLSVRDIQHILEQVALQKTVGIADGLCHKFIRPILHAEQGAFLCMTKRRNQRDDLYGSGSFKKVKPAFNLDGNGEKKFVVLTMSIKDLKARFLFEQEVKMLEYCSSKEIALPVLKVLLSKTKKGRLNGYILTERADMDLLTFLGMQLKRITPQERCHIALQVSKKISCMHFLGFVHADLKPDNILLKDGACYLADFGFSKSASDNKSRIQGSLLYLAPELAQDILFKKGESTNNMESDAWALGCILYEVFQSKRKRLITSPAISVLEVIAHLSQDCLDSRLSSEIPAFPCHEKIKMVLQGLLKINPSERWTVQQALDVLEEIYMQGVN